MWAIVVPVAVLTISEQRAVGIMGFRNIAMEPLFFDDRHQLPSLFQCIMLAMLFYAMSDVSGFV